MTSTTVPAARRLALALCASALLLAACTTGGDTGAAPSAAGTTASATASAPASPSQFLDRLADGIATHDTVSVVGKGVTFTGGGDMDYENGAYRLNVVTEDGDTIHIVGLEGKVYTQENTDGGTWTTIDPDQVDFDQLSPTGSLAAWRAGATSLRTAGAETIKGAPTTHYVLTVDLAKALTAQGASAPQGAPSSVDYSIYVDEQFLMRRVTLALGGSEQTFDFSQWGAPLEIVAPPLG